MYQYEPVEIFKRVVDANHEERNRALQRGGERKVPTQLSNNLLENISSNFSFPRPKRDIFAKKSFFPKTQVQENILYKKPQFTLRNVVKYHGYGQPQATYQTSQMAPAVGGNRIGQQLPIQQGTYTPSQSQIQGYATYPQQTPQGIPVSQTQPMIGGPGGSET